MKNVFGRREPCFNGGGVDGILFSGGGKLNLNIPFLHRKKIQWDLI